MVACIWFLSLLKDGLWACRRIYLCYTRKRIEIMFYIGKVLALHLMLHVDISDDCFQNISPAGKIEKRVENCIPHGEFVEQQIKFESTR